MSETASDTSWHHLTQSLSTDKPPVKRSKRRSPALSIGSKSEWRAQAREDYQLFSTINPLVQLSEGELQYVFSDLDRPDLEYLLERIDEALPRYVMALATIRTARPITVGLIEEMVPGS